MTDKTANKMWGGRFTSSPAAIMEEINASVGFDKVLAPQDIRASKAHAAMLGKQGIISKEDARKIAAGLDRLLAETDSPFLAPVPVRGTRNEPAHVALVLDRLASLYGIPPSELAARTTANFHALFRP